MKTLLHHPCRVTSRLLWLGGEIFRGLGTYITQVLFQTQASRSEAQAIWLHRTCRRALRLFNISLQITGPVPAHGFLVCNHLSYLDILVLSALAPCTFVAKSDVKFWPVFGWFATLAGTVYVNRRRRSDVAQASQRIKKLLEENRLVVLFPEGTSSDGRQVLPFKSSLLEPACHNRILSAGWLNYSLDKGSVGDEVCYWRDMTFLPHLINLLSKPAIHATVHFTQLTKLQADRKQLAHQLHFEVCRLKESTVVCA